MTKSNSSFWTVIFERERLSVAKRHRDRLSVATRMVRELARLKGLVRDEQLLMDSQLLLGHWGVPIEYINPHPPGPEYIRKAFISMGPPETPSFADPHLLQWVDIMEAIAARIGIYSTAQGLRGIYQMLDPAHTQGIFPRPEEIMAFERFQIEEILQAQVQEGVFRSMKILTREEEGYSLSMPEAKRALQLSKSIAPEITQAEIETEKAMMILRIEDVIQNAKTQGDIRAELQALKLLTFVQGLHRVSGDDTMQELMRVISETGRKMEKFHQQQPKTIDTEPVAMLEEPEET